MTYLYAESRIFVLIFPFPPNLFFFSYMTISNVQKMIGNKSTHREKGTEMVPLGYHKGTILENVALVQIGIKRMPKKVLLSAVHLF